MPGRRRATMAAKRPFQARCPQRVTQRPEAGDRLACAFISISAGRATPAHARTPHPNLLPASGEKGPERGPLILTFSPQAGRRDRSGEKGPEGLEAAEGAAPDGGGAEIFFDAEEAVV